MNTNQGPASERAAPIRKAYWVCQASGWSALFVLQMAQMYAFKMSPRPPLFRVMSALAMFCAVGVVVTHLLSLLMRRRQWLQMPVRKAWPRLALAVALATT